MKLAEPVMRGKHILVPETTILTEKTIDIIKQNKEIDFLFVFEEKNKRDYSTWEEAVQEKYENAVDRIKDFFMVANYSQKVSVPELNDLASYTLDNLLKENFVLQSLKNLQSTDDYTYRHSINVGVLSGILAKWLKYDDEKVFQVVVSGLLHDIGKSQIPLDILNKPDKLSDGEMFIMRKHAEYGYELLKNVPDLEEGIKLAVLQHHERIDGRGYPHKLKEQEIHDFAKIVAVADTYDAVTSNRVYQKARSPFSLLDLFQEDMFVCLDAPICLLMLAQIKNSLIGRSVLMEDGRKAKVIFIGSQTSDDIILQTENGELLNFSLHDYEKFNNIVN